MPTRILIRWPICSETSSTRARISASCSRSAGRRGAVDAGRRPVGAEGLAQDRRPLAGRRARLGGGDRRRHHVLGLVGGDLGQLGERRLDRVLVALGLPGLERLDPLALDLGVGGEDAAVGARRQRRVLGLGEAVLADHLLLAALDPRHPLAVGLDQAGLHVGDGGDGAAVLLDHGHLGAGALGRAPRPGRPSPSSPRRCRGTRAGRSRWRAPAGCAGSTAGPRGGGGPSPRSRRAAGSRGRGRRG